jgi:hypothetical protein
MGVWRFEAEICMHLVPNGVCAFRLTTAAAEKRISCVLCAYKNLVHFPLADKEADVWFVHTGQRIVYQPAKNWVSRPVSQSVSVCAFIKVQIRKYTRALPLFLAASSSFLVAHTRRLSFFYLFYSLLSAAAYYQRVTLSSAPCAWWFELFIAAETRASASRR